MTYTDKVGYTVRFGGPEGIQWIKTGESGGSPFGPINPAAATNPFGLVIEATKAVALVLQWWEMRKQTLLQTAQFEERRIPWLADMLFQWTGEVNNGVVRLDTAIYFDREVARLLDKISETKLMDVPSSLLLQVERTAHAMVAVNSLLHGGLGSQQANFVLPNQTSPQLPRYRPFWELEGDDKEIEKYLSNIAVSSAGLSSLRPALLIPGSLILPFGGALLGIAAWTYLSWTKARAAASQRLDDFRSLTAIALELRSLRAQLSFMAFLPPREEFLTLPEAEDTSSR